jgi:hypothetical protein
MPPAHQVEIVIYDAPAARQSGCGCGCDHHHGDEAGHSHGHDHGYGRQCGDSCDPYEKISMEKQTQALAVTLEQEFPGKVRVEYINVMQDPRGSTLPQTKLLASLTYPPPLVYFNGKGRFAGALPVERIREEVETILAAKAKLRLV